MFRKGCSSRHRSSNKKVQVARLKLVRKIFKTCWICLFSVDFCLLQQFQPASWRSINQATSPESVIFSKLWDRSRSKVYPVQHWCARSVHHTQLSHRDWEWESGDRERWVFRVFNPNPASSSLRGRCAGLEVGGFQRERETPTNRSANKTRKMLSCCAETGVGRELMQGHFEMVLLQQLRFIY